MAGDADFDRELLARVRAGDDTAYGELFSRHADAVRRFALRHVREHAEADDLTAEAFFRVLQAIRRGTGPTDHVRTYLLTVARRVAWEWSGRRRDVPVDDEELSRRVEPFPDATVGRAEHTLISRAFTSLPERWRSVLWQVEVEGARPAAVAPSFGLSPNAMAALARRAREGLRAAYLQAHLAEDSGPRACSSVLSKLGTYTAGGVQGAEQRRIRKHLQTCSSCNALHAELTEVCSSLRAHAASIAVPVAATALVAPAVLGKAAWLTGRVKLVLAGVASAAAVGLFGMVAGAFTGGPGPALLQTGPQGSDGENVLALCSTNATVTGAPTSAESPAPTSVQVHRVDHTQVRTSVVTETVTERPTSSSQQVLAVPVPSGAPTTSSEVRLFQEPPNEPVATTATTTTTAEPTKTAFVSTTSAAPTVTPTTVTLSPTSSSLKAT
ncbi:sigma-70 family RNA polymerase sigma factor [Saccharothrix variisporea]|uniref:RNA polymerase sigma factor (Sigma-70 family) n=1 Tax=Saccharothrix variisporea TaxID=543527 RepID=A0A495XAE9_9PSEU|nr:sigma-70 family RNA polymerase sigma factor [Saccharothrix variisporea]RKT71461.1 RNA polymerase sigma factor (sigma-70 family) [Saccharothrix variisporea]